jgi:hypothetical protein
MAMKRWSCLVLEAIKGNIRVGKDSRRAYCEKGAHNWRWFVPWPAETGNGERINQKRRRAERQV